MIFHVMGAVAEFKRSLIGERTSARMKGCQRRASR